MRRIFVTFSLMLFFAGGANAATDKPNILIVWGDDIGWFNTSAYNRGMMGYQTPNIDRIANEGALFTDWYGQQSCTAGRAAFVTGQSPFRTGLLKVGLPGAKEGLSEKDPTIAGLLKNHGYMTAQYGKNHLGDLDEHLPSNHGFDEFFGNLYHLNAEEEPESPDYPQSAEFKKKFGPRGVIKSSADGSIEDTGPLTKKRMETVDEEVTAGAIDFMERAVKSEKPFFLWWNSTRMHVNTHLKPESEGVTGLGVYADGMVEHDGHIGQLLDKLDELGIADNTIIMYSSDNGAEVFTWPDGGMTPFRNEKNSNWEGGYRVPTMIKWPGVIKPGTVYNDVFSHDLIRFIEQHGGEVGGTVPGQVPQGGGGQHGLFGDAAIGGLAAAPLAQPPAAVALGSFGPGRRGRLGHRRWVSAGRGDGGENGVAPAAQAVAAHADAAQQASSRTGPGAGASPTTGPSATATTAASATSSRIRARSRR